MNLYYQPDAYPLRVSIGQPDLSSDVTVIDGSQPARHKESIQSALLAVLHDLGI